MRKMKKILDGIVTVTLLLSSTVMVYAEEAARQDIQNLFNTTGFLLKNDITI